MVPSNTVSEPPRGGLLDRLAGWSWRLLVVGAALAAVVWLLAQVRVVLVPLFAALFLTAALAPVGERLVRLGWPRLLATWAVFSGFLAAVVGLVFLLVPAFVDEFKDLGPTVRQGIDDIEGWLVRGPLDLDRADVERYRAEIGEQASDWVRRSAGGIVAGAILVVEILAGAILALVLTFFFVKDGPAIQSWVLARLPERHHPVVRDASTRAWTVLGRYLRACALLGVIEGAVIGTTLVLVGAPLAGPVALLTFAAAFFPIVGAVTAGAIAVLVALVGGGVDAAITVGVVALVVQQFDNDLLAPLVFGRSVRLHPLVVLLSLAVGGTVAGVAGAFLAVPAVAIGVQLVGAARQASVDILPVTRP